MFLSNFIPLLLFALASSAATLPAVQMKNGSEILEIADRPSVIQISEPTTQPTMQREALILDSIEEPCNTAKKAKECKEDDPDLDQTIRPFTNGHGYQFVVYGLKNEDNSDEENSNEENKNDRRNESKKYSNDDKHDGNESKNEEEKGKKDSIGDQKDSKESPKEDFDNENDENMGDKGKKELREDKKDGPEIEIHDSEDKKESNGIMKHGNEDINESKKTRRKRAIRSPPPPPVLPPMDVNMFPSFIRNMISNIPVLRNMLAETDTERPAQDGSRPRTYGFHLNQDKATVFNHLYDTPNYTGNKFNKNGERIEKSKAAYEPDDSDSGTDDDDSGDEDNAGTDDDEDKADDGDYGDKVNYITPYSGLNYKKAVTEEPKLKTGNNKDCKQNKPTGEKIVCLKPKTEKSRETTENINVPISKPRNNNKDNVKDKIAMSINKAREVIPPRVKNVGRNPAQLSFDGTPKTFGLKLIGDHGYVWNDLSDPGSYYEVGEPNEDEDKEDKHKPEIVKPKPEPKRPNIVKEYKPNEDEDKEDKHKPEIVKPKPEPKRPNIVKECKPNENDVKTNVVTTEKGAVTEDPKKEQKKHNNNNNNNNNNNDAVKDALDDLLKKDEFWQWLTKWTAAYIEVLNENIDRLVKKEVAKQIHKIKEAKIEKQKAANVTANKDVGGKNQTATNSTLAEQNNGTDESSPMKANSTETPDQSKNHTNVHKTPPKLNSNTIYGNAIDSDHVTNIFIFYPNTANDTRKELENVPNKTKDGVLKSPINSTDDNVATKPSSSDGTKPNPSDGTKPNPSDGTKPNPSDGTKPNPSDGTKPNPTNGTTAAHSTDKKKDPVPESTTAESSSPNNNSTQNPNSNVANSDVANSTVANSTVANSTVANSTVANSNIVNSTVVNSKVVNSNLANITVANITVANSTDISNKDTPTKTELSSNTATPTSVTPNVSSNPEVSSTNGTTTSNDAAKATTSDTAKPVTQAT